MNLRRIKLGELANEAGGIIQTGPFGSQLHESDYSDEGTPVVMPKDISDGTISPNSIARIPEDKAEKLRRHRMKVGTVVFPRRGDILKKGFVSPSEEGWLCGTGCAQVWIEESHVSHKWLFYYLLQNWIGEWLERHATGSTMLNLSSKVLRNVPIQLPSRETQTRIAEILSAYDDLIEVNRRRMGLLEEAARELYREWFVRLRFPGHESTPIRNGVPEGWERARVADAIQLNPRTKAPHGEVVFVPMSCLSENSMLVENVETKDQASGPKFRRADTLLARITPCLENGKTAFVNFLKDGETACGSTEFIVMRGRKLPPEMVYLFARTENFRAYAIASMTGSSGRQRVQTDALEDLDVLVPTTRILGQFTDQVRPAFGEIEILQIQNTLLAEARDHLLPRLMRGEIDVSCASVEIAS